MSSKWKPRQKASGKVPNKFRSQKKKRPVTKRQYEDKEDFA